MKYLAINNNNIFLMEKNSFYHVSNLKFLNVTNNPIIQLHYQFLNTSNLILLSIINVSFRDINPELFYGSKINMIITEDYHIAA